MRILSLGAGAIGGYFGGRLVESGADVTFLVRPQRKARLLADGLRIESMHGDAVLAVKAIAEDELGAPFDVVVLTCKAYDLPAAIETIRPAVGSGTTVLPLLNGIAHMEVLNAIFGEQRVLGGLAKIAATLTPDGTVKHLNDWRFITLGEQSGEMSPRVLAIQAALERAGVIATAVPDILQKMWEKLVHLSTIAGMTSLMRANVGEIARTEYGVELMHRFLGTSAEIAAAEGFRPPAAFMDEFRTMFADKKGGYTASMLRDIERGGPVEADHVIGFLLKKAEAHGIEADLHKVAYVHLKAYEERRAAGRL